MAEPAPRGTLGTVHNAAHLLQLLSEGPPHHQLSDLATRSGMSLPTLHRLLRSLLAAGLVEQDPGSSRYGLGPQLVRLADQYVTRQPTLRIAAPYLVELRNATKGSALLSILVGDETVVVDRVDGEDAGGVYRDPRRVRPALESPAGRLLLAHADDAVWDAAAAGHDPPPTEEQRRQWRRARHLARPAPTPADLSEAAAVLLGPDGTPRAAVAVTGSPTTFTAEVLEELVVPQLVRASTTISRALGHG